MLQSAQPQPEQRPSAQFSNLGPVKLSHDVGDLSLRYNYERGADGNVVPADLLYQVDIKNSRFNGGPDFAGRFVERGMPDSFNDAATTNAVLVPHGFAEKPTGMLPVKMGQGGDLAYLRLTVFGNEAGEVLPESRQLVVQLRADKKDPTQCVVSGYLAERVIEQPIVLSLKDYSQKNRAHRFQR